MYKRIMIIYPSSNKHLGLWTDLESDNRVSLRCTDLRNIHFILKLFRKFHLNKTINNYLELPFKHVWFNYHDIFSKLSVIDHILVVDGALNQLTIKDLEKCRRIKPTVNVSLFFLNSLNADSPTLIKVRPLINLFNWTSIYTFDPNDAKNYGYKYIGFNHYSYKKGIVSSKVNSDIYFVGGLKGNRDQTIFDVYNYLSNNKVKCHFLLNIKDKPLITEGISYTQNKWIAYEKILSDTIASNCILEILQDNQYGATLRYFEAVCYNKKLLTNNKCIIDYPFYNPRWMKVFSSVSDIDIEWIKEKENVNYNYNDEFSPISFIDKIINEHSYE